MKILVPIDASQERIHPFIYAMKKYPGASYTIMNVSSTIVNDNFPLEVASGLSLENSNDTDIRSRIQSQLGYDNLPDNVRIEHYHGEAVHMICEKIKAEPYDCVFMGCKDKYSLIDKIFGTVTLGVIKSSKVPVFVIPQYATYQGCDRVVVAADDHIAEPAVLTALKAWNSEEAHTKFLHIKEEGSDSFEVSIDRLLKQFTPSFSYEVEEVTSNHVADSLLAKAYNDNAQLLIVIASNSSYIHSLIFQSKSKEILERSALPMLFLHTE